MNLEKLKEIIKAEIKSIKEDEAEMNPKILDTSKEMDEKDKYDAWNFGDAEYYTGMQGKR